MAKLGAISIGVIPILLIVYNFHISETTAIDESKCFERKNKWTIKIFHKNEIKNKVKFLCH